VGTPTPIPTPNAILSPKLIPGVGATVAMTFGTTVGVKGLELELEGSSGVAHI
jgi:hypothetical protein